jgi:RNA polymerase-binding transcription factor DksA
MLDQQYITERKSALFKEKARLEQEIAKRKQFEQYGTSEDDNAQEVAAYEKNLSAMADFRKLLEEVNKALGKIEQGTYGKCELGPEEIEKERLEAFPAATVCIKHQREIDSSSQSRTWYKPWTWRK